MKLSALVAVAAVIGGSILVPAKAQYTENLRSSPFGDINGNPTYRDSNGTSYRHGVLYDPNGIGGYKLRGNDGTTLRCTRGLTDRCEEY